MAQSSPSKPTPTGDSMHFRLGHMSNSSRSSSETSSSSRSHHLIRVYVLQAKLDASAIGELYSMIESQSDGERGLNLQLCRNAVDADIILSNVRMRKRLERHLDWNIAKQKAIVTCDWLRDSIAQQRPLPCREYAALGLLRDETAKNCPDCQTSECLCSPTKSLQNTGVSNSGPNHAATNVKIDNESNYAARYACQRASPLVCPNQSLATELGVLRIHRELEGKNINALSYERAIAIIKSYPYTINYDTFNEVTHLPHLGPKICSKIREFLQSGSIAECENIRSSQRFRSLSNFVTIHNVGATTARHLYSIGLRTIEDMERYYDVPTAPNETLALTDHEPIYTPNGKRVPLSMEPLDFDVKAALTLHRDLTASIPRSEVEEIHKRVMSEIQELQPGCSSTITGGYRRGKIESNDVDIVITHSDLRSDSEFAKTLRKRVIQQLYERGLVTHEDIGQSGFHARGSFHPRSLDTVLTVFILPPKDGKKNLHRRLDLIFAAPEVYWSAIVGWTGSKMFERDIRLWAKEEKGMKFDSSGITRLHDSKMFYPKSEQDVFSLLGLDWIDPTMRNAGI